MKQSEIQGYSREELQDRLVETQNQYAELRRTHAVSPLENPMQLRTKRRTIARIQTALNNKQ